MGGGVGRGGGGGGVVARLGVVDDVQYWGCKPRIEGIVKCTQRYCKLLRIIKIIKRGGGCGCRGLDLTQNHLKLEKKSKKKRRKKWKKLCLEGDLNP